MKFTLGPLPHTWLIDLDGTVLLHNGYKNGVDVLLPGVLDFWQTLPASDYVVLMSARELEHQAATLNFLRKVGLWWSYALFGLPIGERILINDTKPSGMQTAVAINLQRDNGMGGLDIEYNSSI